MRVKSSLWFHGGEATQRIANPLPHVEKLRLFLQKIALQGRNTRRTCKTLCTGAALIALAACDVPPMPEDTALDQGAELGRLCIASAELEHCLWRCDREFSGVNGSGLLHETTRRRACLGAVYEAAADPAPELAGGPEGGL